jgi:hypothetical protein
MITKVIKTDSSMLDELAFNRITKKLTATFKGGAKYAYKGVSRSDWRLLLSTHNNGASVGKIFDVLIKKDASISYTRLGE